MAKDVVLDQGLLSNLTSLANLMQGGILVCDRSEKILFAHGLEKIFGYSDDAIVGKQLGLLLPNYISAQHKSFINTFLDGDFPQRKMAPKAVAGQTAEGKAVMIQVALDQHGKGDNAVAIAFVSKDDQNEVITAQSIFSAKFTKLGRKAKVAIAKKIAASGGILGFIAWLITAVTPIGTAIGTAIKAFRAAFAIEASNPGGSSENFGVYEIIDSDTRYDRLILVRNALQKYSSNVIAVAYFQLVEYGLSEQQLRYVADSGNVANEEVWFYDSVDNNLLLTPADRTRLLQQECIIRYNAGHYPKFPERGKFNVIFCPTIKIVADPANPGLKRITSVGVAGVAVKPEVREIEPIATLFYKYLPNLETIFPNN